MKLTKTKLRNLIREEIQRLNESTDFKSLEFGIKDSEGGKIKIYLEQDYRHSNTYYLKAKQNGRNIAIDYFIVIAILDLVESGSYARGITP